MSDYPRGSSENDSRALDQMCIRDRGRAYDRSSGRRMLTDDEELFQGTAQEAEDEKERTGISKYAGRKSLIEEPRCV